MEALAAEIGDGVRIDVLPADLADAADRDRLAAEVERLGRRVDILVNCAGFGIYEPFVRASRERELEQVRVNVEAVVDLSARYVPAMVERGRGAVINFSSTAGFQPLPCNADYAAAKSFVLLHSEALNAELRGTGVTVTAVCPGPVPTGFQEASDAQFAERLPKMVWVSAERVATDVLRAAEKGRRSVIPGGLPVRLAFAANRYLPPALTLPVSRRLMARD
jgi:short-subunit dehydrogenase